MDQKQIDRFFRVFNQALKDTVRGKIKVILTGAAAGILMGGNRPSIDIDFAVLCEKKHWEDIEGAIKHVSSITGIAVNFSEDIDRWSEITFLDYKRHTLPYKTFGNIEVAVLSPAYWSIGKITRYLDPDVDDLVKVFKNKGTPAIDLARLWGEALLKSPRSSATFLFKKHVEHFFQTYGRLIWGKGFDKNKCLQVFFKACSQRR